MDTKIIIISNSFEERIELAKKLTEIDDELTIAPMFTSDDEYNENINENYIYYMSSEDINIAYKNNALLFILTENFISTGITMDNMYNNDIFCLSYHNFNDITDHVLLNQDVIIVWLDSKFIDKFDPETKKNLRELNYVENRLDYLKYLYFLDEDKTLIANTIIEYINADEETRKQIIENNQ